MVVYDASRQETHDRLSSHWLPLIEKTLGIPPPLSASQEKERAEDTGEEGGSSAAFPKPVVLAANKVYRWQARQEKQQAVFFPYGRPCVRVHM